MNWNYLILGYTPDKILLLILVVGLSNLIRSIAGIGGNLIGVSVLAIYFDLKFLAPVFTILLIANRGFLLKKTKDISKLQTLKLFLIGILFGSVLGSYLLISLNTKPLNILLGLVTIAFAFYMVFKNKNHKLKIFENKLSELFFGLFSGSLGAAVSTGSGPLFTIFITQKFDKKEDIRTSLFQTSLLANSWKLLLYAIAGLINLTTILFTLLLLPVIWLTSELGELISKRVNQKQFKYILVLVLLISGITLLFS